MAIIILGVLFSVTGFYNSISLLAQQYGNDPVDTSLALQTTVKTSLEAELSELNLTGSRLTRDFWKNYAIFFRYQYVWILKDDTDCSKYKLRCSSYQIKYWKLYFRINLVILLKNRAYLYFLAFEFFLLFSE